MFKLLIHLYFRFLRVDTLTESKKAWTRLLMPSFSCYFKRLFENISIRLVVNELSLACGPHFILTGRLKRRSKMN